MSTDLVRQVSEEGRVPVSARQALYDAREDQMRLILRCYMENSGMVSFLKANTFAAVYANSDDRNASKESLYDYFKERIREIEEDHHDEDGNLTYYSMYGTRQSGRRTIIDELRRLSWKFKVKVKAPSMKTVGHSGR